MNISFGYMGVWDNSSQDMLGTMLQNVLLLLCFFDFLQINICVQIFENFAMNSCKL
jgi:hypothetical protein